MAAGLGFKTFNTGDVLSAADVNGYLMQGILVFASATARDAAITSPQEGQFAFLKDTNVTTYYTGSAWANVDTTGMTNPMTTTGDVIYSSSGSTPARLGIGTAGQVLQVNSGATAPEWATPAGGGGKVLQMVHATYTTFTRSQSNAYADTGLTATITPTASNSKILIFMFQLLGHEGANADSAVSIKLLRGATSINENTYVGRTSAAVEAVIPYTLNIVDSPATTSATTYKTQFMNPQNAQWANLYNTASGPAQMILLEIGA